MTIQMPEKVKYIIETIQAAGFEAYAVGGCVRDSVLGRIPDDWDITTSAKPEQVKALFRRTIDTGLQHGTVTVMLDKDGFEVTTYRIDGKYEDGRHPTEVIFTACLEEDLKRRDFTINAMAYNEKSGLVDIFGGLKDIERKVIRCVGEPEARFGEDALRIMRAVRFSAQLGYEIEKQTKEAIVKLAHTLKQISAERIQVELVKLLVSPNPDFVRVAFETGITKVILPEFDQMMACEQNTPHHCYTVGEHTIQALKLVPADKVYRLGMLLHDIGKPETKTTDEDGKDHFYGHPSRGEEMAKDILRRLKFDNDTIYKVTKIVRFHDYGNSFEPTHKNIRKVIHKMGEDIFPLMFAVKKADILAQSLYQREEKLENLARCQQVYEEVKAAGDCLSLKTLAVTGKDLMEAGVQPGPRLGEILAQMLEEVLEDPGKNTKEYLLSRIP